MVFTINGTEVPTPICGDCTGNSEKIVTSRAGVSIPSTSSAETDKGTEVPTPIHGKLFGSPEKIIASGYPEHQHKEHIKWEN